MKKKKITRSMTAMLLLFVIAGACIGTSLAFITDKAEDVTNTMIPGRVTTQVVEKFEEVDEEYVKSKVQIKNTGNTEAYIRAAVVVTWQKIDEDGNILIYGEAPKANDYTISLETGENDAWIEGADGFYYHKTPVKSVEQDPNACTTGILIESCTLSEDADVPEDYNLCVEIIASGIQAKGEVDGKAVVEKEWFNSVNNLELNNNNEIAVKTVQGN